MLQNITQNAFQIKKYGAIIASRSWSDQINALQDDLISTDRALSTPYWSDQSKIQNDIYKLYCGFIAILVRPENVLSGYVI